ncbi:type I DNA topoisomerase [Saccharomonospora halophila]|uniref:type I DNA topoisomerase n=1 Tax=Saccharomonospora halophila TaxID=129922 RepID=UPI000372F6D5|nr:type I DNA topoisomerase [Saccharomonospora halophila]
MAREDSPSDDRATEGAGGNGRRRLVIVESPTKARKIAPYLGSGYVVESSRGHVRDLPRGAADVPAKYKGQPWARLGVDVDNGFEPLYVVSPDKKSTITELKGLLADVDELYLATDPDREGEAIAWHLLEALRPKVPVRRMVFHEVTEQAIRAAAESTRELDSDLVDAQETRRILDRLYGYEVSPVLWKKVMPKLSAGRVQSVATRIVVERERERMRFTSASYWDIAATMDAGDDASPRTFPARLTTVDGARLATGRDFGPDGQLKRASADVRVLDEAEATRLAGALADRELAVSNVEEKPYTRRPYAPFMTSTLQQEAGRKLRFSSERTMRIAQRLYENGYITYMRTDSTTLSEAALTAARNQATELYGADHVSDKPRQYNRKVKNAQEAHEAIRPAGEVFATPGAVANELETDSFRLYELIWQRTIASQMADAKGTTMSVRITGTAADGAECVFSASGRTITFPGFLRAYVESVDAEAGGEADDKQSRLPHLSTGLPMTATALNPDAHATSPPARYSEPALVSKLEELGIGRPSTYASIINTIQDRGYVWKKGSALVPSWVAFSVVGLLERHFERLVDYDFTAAMEDELDRIASGDEQRTDWLSRFYFGGDLGADGSIGRLGGLKKLVGSGVEDIDAREINSIPMFTDDEGRLVVVRVGRYGPYLERPDGEGGSQRANLPDDLPPDELTVEVAEKLFATPQEGRTLGTDPETGHEIVAKEGRFGPYVTEVLPEPEEPADGKKTAKAKKPKPRTASLFKSMSIESMTLDDALNLLSLPRVVGTDPESGEEITAQNGRYGPYLKKGTDSRSLNSEEQIFEITMDEALKLYAEPKRRGRQAAPKPPLREMGEDPESGKPMTVKDGRFGPYVTDGEYNASLRRSDSVEDLTRERAAELLAEKRAKGPAPKKGTKKKSTTASSETSSSTKSTASKATASKSTASKSTGSKSTGSKSTGSKSTGSKSTGSKSTGSKSAGSKSTASKSTTSKSTTSKSTTAKSTGSGAASSRSAATSRAGSTGSGD